MPSWLRFGRIVHMFDEAERDDWADLTVHPVAALVALAEANQAELKERENRVLRIAAAWADAYPGDPSATSPLLERGMQWGGDGTPLVGEFAATELAPLLGKSHGGARALIADVLDIRHRLPLLSSTPNNFGYAMKLRRTQQCGTAPRSA